MSRVGKRQIYVFQFQAKSNQLQLQLQHKATKFEISHRYSYWFLR